MQFCRMVPCAIALVVASAVSGAWAAETLTYADLVHRMTDLTHLAILPATGEKCAQWSSWERRSKCDEKSGKYISWDANADARGCIRMEGKLMVMAEMKGPGCIWRIWSANAQKGHVKIYLDGQEMPAVDLPFDKYFSGDTAPFIYPMLSYDLAKKGSKGLNVYMPIPYQKSCKIVADPGWGEYYHFTYGTFPSDVRVPTFSAALARDNAEALRKTDDFFRHRLGEDPAGDRPGQEIVRKKITIAPGHKVQVAQLTGPRAISTIRVKGLTFADRQDQVACLQKMALEITWDGQSTPAVWCPLGDFFGTAPGENLYRSLLTGMTKDGYYAHWYMPFAKSASIELCNDDEKARNLDVEIVYAPPVGPIEDMGRFHAKWKCDSRTLPADRFPDWIVLEAQGRGRFCGMMLHVWNPRGGWWGEGDEKFFVDGEKFPSTFGTGSEDYFGYAWGDPGLFQMPYHCQTMSQDNKGHQSLLRWHVADNVPFLKSFEGCIEKYDHPGKGVEYASTAYWYLSPDGNDPYNALPGAKHDGLGDQRAKETH